MPDFDRISETRSLLSSLFSGNYLVFYGTTTKIYSLLIVFLPITVILYARFAIKKNQAHYFYYLCAILFGSIFLLAQLRFSYHAPYILLVPALLVAQDWINNPQKSKPLYIALVATFVVLSHFNISQGLFKLRYLGGQVPYKILLPFYKEIAAQCEQQSGNLLAHPDEGHYLRYHTNCKIFANNMLATQDDFKYRILAFEMLKSRIGDFASKYEDIDYIYVRREDSMDANEGLRADFLIDNLGEYQVLVGLNTENGPYAQLIWIGGQ